MKYFNSFIDSQIHNNININYGKVIMNGKTTDEKIDRFNKLLGYAPANFIDKILLKLEEYKKLDSFD